MTNISASATAAVTPRDMALVADLSGSQSYDSELKRYKDRTINLYEVWDAFPGGAYEDPTTWEDYEVPEDVTQAAGPGWGFFKQLGFGDDPADSSYNPATDPGLISWRPARGTMRPCGTTSATWGTALPRSTPSGPRQAAATRTALPVAMGLAYWNSGMPGGLWSGPAVTLAGYGNGNSTIGDSEITWAEQVFRSFDGHVGCHLARLHRLRPRWWGFQYRFGIKTFMGYTLDRRKGPSKTPEIADAPVQAAAGCQGRGPDPG